MQYITAKQYKEMLMYAGEVINLNKEEINALNVFPVPDGDTGSNMNMTFQAGIDNIITSESQLVGEIAKSFSKGLLMGARGNSGVILSQFFRGISEELESIEQVDSEKFHKAIKSGSDRAYASVIKAVEGTILTVGKEMHQNTKVNSDLIKYFENLISSGEVSLENTPNLLPILKEAGVVDSGGKGLLVIFQGMLANLKGEKLDVQEVQNFDRFRETETFLINPEDIEHGFCTEVLVALNNPKEIKIEDVREKLTTFGDSIVAIQDDNILKVHVHSETPIAVFEYAQTLGSFVHIKSENMRIQAEDAQNLQNQNKKELGIVAVSSSDKMSELFNSIQNVEIISGGQTLNPSTEDIVNAIQKANAKHVIVLPNNSNVIMAAKAAKDLVEGVEVKVLETKFMTQAIEVLINYSADNTLEENIVFMKDCLAELQNIEITKAIKDTTIGGTVIQENDFLGIIQGNIKYSTANEEILLEKIFADLIELEVGIITVLLGEDANVKLIDNLKNKVIEDNPFLEIEIHDTKQPIYPYLISGV